MLQSSLNKLSYKTSTTLPSYVNDTVTSSAFSKATPRSSWRRATGGLTEALGLLLLILLIRPLVYLLSSLLNGPWLMHGTKGEVDLQPSDRLRPASAMCRTCVSALRPWLRVIGRRGS